MNLSRRVTSLRPSATLAVSARARELRAGGADVLSFAAGEPDFRTPERVREAAIRALRDGMTGYGPVPGAPEAREAVAAKLVRENGLEGVTAEHVVLSSGGKHTLYQLFQALLDPPEAGAGPAEVLLPVPAWVSYAPQIRLAGGSVVELPTSAECDFKITPDQLRSAITEQSRVLVLNSPSNPCGTMYSQEELRGLAAVVAEAAARTAPGLVVITDELYEKIVYGGIEHFSIGSVPEIAERVVTVNGLSKAWAMTGWRIGFFGCPGAFGLELAKAVTRLQSQSTTSIATFLNPAVRVALEECGDEVESMRKAFAERAGVMHGLIDAIPGVVAPTPTGAFYVFADVSAHFGKRGPGGGEITDSTSFASALLDARHVACVPGADFGAGGERCCRFSFACDEATIREGMERLASFVGELE